MDATWSHQKAICAALLVAALFVQASAWDEADLAELKYQARAAHADAVRYLVEESGYRAPTASDFHCRAPMKGERLVMQHAAARDPGKGYRCTYWRTDRPLDKSYTTVTWSRSPEVRR